MYLCKKMNIKIFETLKCDFTVKQLFYKVNTLDILSTSVAGSYRISDKNQIESKPPGKKRENDNLGDYQPYITFFLSPTNVNKVNDRKIYQQ